MNSYYELLIKINPDIADIVSDICFANMPCEGIILTEETYKDLKLIASTVGTLKVFLSSSCDVKKILSEQRNLLINRGLSEYELGSWEFSITEKDNQDWAKKWKEKWDITHVTDKIVVIPDWIEYKAKDNEITIRLEPGCAFGTGTHPTTQLCMRAIENYMNKNCAVADIGTGSGILSICAKKFGAKYVYGCDNDENVIDVAKENAKKNNAECTFELNTADGVDKKFDFIMANILHNVLAEIMPDLKKMMKSDSILVLSGILKEKQDVVKYAINKNDLNIVDTDNINQWISFIVRR